MQAGKTTALPLSYIGPIYILPQISLQVNGKRKKWRMKKAPPKSSGFARVSLENPGG